MALRQIAIVTFGLSLVGCDPQSTPKQPTNLGQPQIETRTPISIRNIAGGPVLQAFLVDPMPDPPRDQLAEAVQETGNRCDHVTAFNQLEQNGKVLPVYKLDCGKRSYQVTFFDGHSHIKRWTGNILFQ